ncbi:DUF883 family protein [Oryzicola mucosus]|uniref:DUF883 family protein n=1 Tax=Oryzicola mucosus TaxID=2767425 RepID=A0A8J6Q508_9HYPH|nr:DUF883 family protein [Oryzicola mucosus]MBD0416570.1 DUF883 family protein [Oryzicola mucosus]
MDDIHANSDNQANADNDGRKDLEKQIADLKNDIANITKTLSERSEQTYQDLRAKGGEAYNRAADTARNATHQVRAQAHAVSDAIKENPGTAATVLSSAGLIGFLIGITVGQAIANSHNESRRWW